MTGKNVYLNLFRKNLVYDFSSENFMWHLDSTMWNRFSLSSPRFPQYTVRCAQILYLNLDLLSLNVDQT